MTDFSGNVSFFTENFHSLVQPGNSVVQEVASELNSLSYARIDSFLSALIGRVRTIFDFDTDMSLYGLDDYWASPDEMVQAGAGDCDDFALFASSVLHAMGLPHDVVMGYYQGAGGHAWVEVHGEGSTYILEFTEPQLHIIPESDYSFIPYMPVARVIVE